MRTYQHHFSVPLHDIDAAGVLFFAHLHRHAHNAYENFMSDIGFSLDRLIKEKQCLPIIHSEGNFQLPIYHGEKITVALQIKKIGISAFTVAYQFLDKDQTIRATASTTHVHLDHDTHQSKALPKALTGTLNEYLENP